MNLYEIYAQYEYDIRKVQREYHAIVTADSHFTGC